MDLNELYLEINNHLLNDAKPSLYLKDIIKNPLIKVYPFDMIYKMNLTKQCKKHHPEGDVFSHTLLVVDEAAKVKEKSKDASVFMWAAFLHDIGKPPTTKLRNGNITSYNHDTVGAKMAKEFLSFFKVNEHFIEDVKVLVLYHMQILFVVKNHEKANIRKMKKDADIDEIALLGLCDRLGRLKDNRKIEEENIREFLRICKS